MPSIPFGTPDDAGQRGRLVPRMTGPAVVYPANSPTLSTLCDQLLYAMRPWVVEAIDAGRDIEEIKAMASAACVTIAGRWCDAKRRERP